MPEINQNQALLPQGATFLPNKLGSAVGILFEENNRLCVALPGVPAEMKQIFSDELAPLLRERIGNRVVFSRVIRTSGIAESALAEKVAPEIPLPEGVTLAYLPHYYGVDLRLTVNAEHARLAEELIEQPLGWLKRKLGALIYGEENQTLEEVVGALLAEQKATIALAESCTAGLLTATVANVPGASRYLCRGYITYSNKAKVETLGVNETTLKEHGAVSAVVAEEMARGALLRAQTRYAVSVTGIAGPDGGTDEKPVGLTFIAVAQRITTNEDASSEAGKETDSKRLNNTGDVTVYSREFRFGSDRTVNRQRATSAALNTLRLVLLGENPFTKSPV